MSKLYKRIVNINKEEKFISFILRKYFPKDAKILDVGCGLGNKLEYIKNIGYADIVGVEKNKELIAEVLRTKNIPILSSEQFEKTSGRYDLIIMSHLIEHFNPDDLLVFMDSYLDRLKTGGYLLILTPTMTEYFYFDFDHIKPYHPAGILMFFGKAKSQVQNYSRNKLGLSELFFNRVPFKKVFTKKQLLGKRDYPAIFANLVWAIIYHLSFSAVAQTVGWIGLFKKLGDSKDAIGNPKNIQ
ncbi:MAG: class I SAM-dependent methyltransferase [Patescibacteria group bacterium]|nr:class I SAM-dependent methyltransferase [Patescibacteria group bacterium]